MEAFDAACVGLWLLVMAALFTKTLGQRAHPASWTTGVCGFLVLWQYYYLYQAARQPLVTSA